MRNRVVLSNCNKSVEVMCDVPIGTALVALGSAKYDGMFTRWIEVWQFLNGSTHLAHQFYTQHKVSINNTPRRSGPKTTHYVTVQWKCRKSRKSNYKKRLFYFIRRCIGMLSRSRQVLYTFNNFVCGQTFKLRRAMQWECLIQFVHTTIGRHN